MHFVMTDGEHRPAQIVKVWGQDNGCSNLVVTLDGSNDRGRTFFPLDKDVKASAYDEGKEHYVDPLHMWATSVVNDEEGKVPGTWHWIEKA